MHHYYNTALVLVDKQVHRAFKLFNTTNGLRRIKISNKDLVTKIAVLCGVDIIILIIW
jgi:hypothetical protein